MRWRPGWNPAEFSGHSLRAGFATSAAEIGASIVKIIETTRHRSVDTLVRYVGRVDLFKDHAGAGFLTPNQVALFWVALLGCLPCAMAADQSDEPFMVLSNGQIACGADIEWVLGSSWTDKLA